MDIVTINGFGSGDNYNPVVNNYSILSQPAYWRAMNFLADNLASFDIDVFKGETKVAHSLDKFFTRRANQAQTAHSYWRTLFFHSEHTGNGYGYVRRASFASSTIVGLHNLLPEDVTPFRFIPEGESVWDATTWYWNKPTQTAIASEDIIHIPGLGYDGFVGYSPSTIMASTFRKAGAIERYSLRIVERGTNIKGTIEFPDKVTKETVAECLDNLRKFKNLTGDRDIMVLSGGAKLNNAGISPADMALDAQDAAITKKISQITGVNPRFLFEHSESKYTDNAEAAGDDVVRFLFRTRIENIENELTVKLLSEAEQDAGYSIRLDASALLRGDVKTETEIAGMKVNQALATVNEVRPDLGLAPDPAPESDKLRNPTHLATSAPQEGENDEQK